MENNGDQYLARQGKSNFVYNHRKRKEDEDGGSKRGSDGLLAP
jgi:hypothetical protein